MPHVLELCVTEMLARTVKRIMNRQMSELVMENRQEYRYLEDLIDVNKKQVNVIKQKYNVKELVAREKATEGKEREETRRQLDLIAKEKDINKKQLEKI